ncbi:conjugative transposon protein TraJ, partial [Prevotella melaninogenica]
LSPVVQGTEMMVHQQEGNLAELTAKRDKLQEEAYLRNPETAYLVSNEKFDEKIEEMGIIGPEDAVTIAGMYAERAAYQTKQWIMKMVHDLLELLFHAAGLIIDTLRTFILIVLAILGPIVFGIAVWDGLAGSLTAWFSRYISVYLWLPVSSILTALLTKIQVLMIEKDIEALSDPNYLPDSGTWYYIVFFLIGIVGYFCVPTVAGWIIEAGGGIGSYGRNVNQTAQHGAQGAYTGGKAAMAGAGAAVGNVGGRIKGALLKGK